MILSGHKIPIICKSIDDLYVVHSRGVELPRHWNIAPKGTYKLVDHRPKIRKNYNLDRYAATYVTPNENLNRLIINKFGECQYILEITDRLEGDLMVARHPNLVDVYWAAFSCNAQQ